MELLRSFSLLLVACGLLVVKSGEVLDGDLGVIEVQKPVSDEVLLPGIVLVRYLVRPDGEGWPEDHKGVAVGLYLDGGQVLDMQRVDWCADQRDVDSCVFSKDVNVEQAGQHLISVRLLAKTHGESEDWDPVWEVCTTFEVTESLDQKGTVPVVKSVAEPAASAGPKITFVSPRRSKSSFLDPNNVVIRFIVDPPEGHADVEVSGRKFATAIADIDVSLEAAVSLPYLPPDHYDVTVFLKNSGGARTGVFKTVEIFTWPDHSWVKNIVAEGRGLSSVHAGEQATFHIMSRDSWGALTTDGGDWFVVRLVGPSIISAVATHQSDAEYKVSYMAAEEGEYNLFVQLHYDKGTGLFDFGVENSRDIIGWDIQGSPFKVTVLPPPHGPVPSVNPYVSVPFCASLLARHDDSLGRESMFAGRWVSKEHCNALGLSCRDVREEDDDFVWIPWRCRLRTFVKRDVEACAREGGGFSVLIAGTSQQRTVFFDVAKLLGSTENQPLKYWIDLVAGDVTPNLFFHWMIPGYDDNDGFLDYPSLIEGLAAFVKKYARSAQDVLIVQASVHDIHLGSLDEYAGHIRSMAKYLAETGLRVLFRAGDALHLPPGARSIIERGLRDPRIRHVNDIARTVMAEYGIPFIDTHVSTIGRPDKCIDGYHYFDRETETLDELGLEICIGNSVARTQAQLLLNFVCDFPTTTDHARSTVGDKEL